MTTTQKLQAYAYVTRPYELVRQSLGAQPLEIFRAATHAAAQRAGGIAASLRVELGGVEIATDVNVEVLGVENAPARPGHPATTTIKLAWQAARGAAFFPTMTAQLVAYTLTKDETQLELHGAYVPPLGLIGAALDMAAGHRIAEASVRRFIEDVAKHLSGAPESSAA